MKLKKVLLFLLVAGVVIGLAACGTDTEEDNTEEENTEENDASSASGEENEEGASDSLEGTITMAGSTSVQPLSEELAAAFMEEHPDTRLEVSGGGSGAGVTAAQDDAADFGAASREIKEDETGIEEWVVAIDGIAIVVRSEEHTSELQSRGHLV